MLYCLDMLHDDLCSMFCANMCILQTEFAMDAKKAQVVAMKDYIGGCQSFFEKVIDSECNFMTKTLHSDFA